MIAVGGAFAAHHYGYSALVTSLPGIKERIQVDDFGLSMLLLAVTLSAAVGAGISDPIAVRWGSRPALVAGLVMEGFAFLGIAFLPTIQQLTPVLMLAGLGLGFVGAAANMQMGIVERAWGRPVFGRFYAAGTSASIISTMVTLSVLSMGFANYVPIIIGGLIMFVAGIFGIKNFDPAFASQPKKQESGEKRVPLPFWPIIGVGLIILSMSAIDTTVGTWEAVYGSEILELPIALAALGYSAYLAAVLVARLTVDWFQRRFGRRKVAIAAAFIGITGFTMIVVATPVPLALAGFSFAGIASGAIVPITYGRASELVPKRSDQVLARVNLFDYAGALLGTVLPGLLTLVVTLNWAYAMPITVLVLCIPLFSLLRQPAMNFQR